MKKKQIKTLEKVIDNSYACCIKREKIDDKNLYGFPIKYNDKFILIENEYDFQIDGYKIIRTKDITEIRYKRVDKHSNYILEKEGLRSNSIPSIVSDIKNFKKIFSQIKKSNKNIIIEGESLKEKSFFIGKVIDPKENYVDFLYFSAIGEWDESPTKIKYKNITCITYNDRYTEITSKYLKE